MIAGIAPDRTQRPPLRRFAAAVTYWLAVLIVAVLLVLTLLWFLESRDASSLDAATA
ncbi:MAG TPA: hypothetical protein VGP30_02390 [Candidatus Limnocylindrales bacterium]|nr:hypothetical protein [Candidatus Limnocylindrales bacterium]